MDMLIPIGVVLSGPQTHQYSRMNARSGWPDVIVTSQLVNIANYFPIMKSISFWLCNLALNRLGIMRIFCQVQYQLYNNIQLLTFVEVNMFVCRPENPILTEALAEVNIVDFQVCKQTY